MNNQKKTQPDKKIQSTKPKPNESLGFQFSSFVKISDPNTKKVLVQKRCS